MHKPLKILITGGSGFIGRHLCRLLQQQGHLPCVLSRTEKKGEYPMTYKWDYQRQEIDEEALTGVDYIVHLAGVNIAQKRWTKKRKKEIRESRIKSCLFLFQELQKRNITLKGFISASAIGYYGAVSTSRIYTETDPAADDFLGETCRLWEEAAENFQRRGIRTVIFRTGIVLSKQGGIVAKLLPMFRLSLGAVLGSGRQFMPWIHLDDLCRMYLRAVEEADMEGVYNAVAPEHVTNKVFTKSMAQVCRTPLWLPPLPLFVLKILLGKMANMFVQGSRVSAQKLIKEGFGFGTTTLKEALRCCSPFASVPNN